MESVYVDVGAQISAGVIEPPQPFLKPKRSAFVFITAESDSSQLAYNDLKKMDEVEEVYLARGAYDIVAKVNGDSLEDIREDILKRIRNLSSIKSTLTLTIV